VSQGRLILTFAVALGAAGCANMSAPERMAGAEDESLVLGPVSPANPGAIAAKKLPSFSMQEALAAAPIPPPPVDLWGRIRTGFQMSERQDPRVAAELAYFIRNPDYMERTVERAQPYLHFIVEEVERRGLPMELALLPVIESAFQPMAYSHAHAAGIWQFIPSTGSHFGLKQTWWYDGRRDVVASTRAALDYLERLYGLFSDWELALAAYNCGEGCVQRAIRNAARQNKPTDFWHLRLPRETRSYVPRLLAVRALVAQPERHGLALRSLPNEPYLEVVEIGSQIDLKLVAELTGLSLDQIYRLNPGFNRWATDPNGPHLLLLPIDKAEPFQQALAALPQSKRVRWERHKIARGETLSHIALRYRTTIEVIKQVNELRGNMLRAGQHLLVPVAQQSHVDYIAKNDARVRQALSVQSRRSQTHKVRSGDTLWEIARRYGVKTTDIARWNNMAPGDTLRVGRVLRVAKPQGGSGQQYVVRRGDSLYEIAQRFNVSVEDLLRWNKLSKKNYLQPGQRLVVQLDVASDEESI
jgi:membrane-bound lytic murein transglycosylase D